MIYRLMRDLALLFAFELLGQYIAHFLPFAIPGSVVGMLLLGAALIAGVVKLEWVEEGAALLIKYMAVMFVPLGVGLVAYLSVLQNAALPFMLSTVISTFVTMAVAGVVFEKMRS